MSRLHRSRGLLASTLLGLAVATAARAQGPPLRDAFEPPLQQGRLADAERVAGEALKARPGDDEARFALGLVQFLRAVEGRIQAFHRHGFHPDVTGLLPITRLPIPTNPKPEPLDYPGARALLRAWVDDLARAEATLAGIKAPDVKLPLHFALIRLDLDGDGKADDSETLWKVYRQFNGRANVSAEAARDFVIAFDRGDVDWLRGYCHVLSAVAEAVLAHDFEEPFRRSGYLFFGGIRPPEPFLAARPEGGRDDFMDQILDYVALVHLVRLPVAEPDRLKAVLVHLRAMVDLSRSSWKHILAEDDDDREWVPAPRQKSVVLGVPVTAEMVAGWRGFLDEFEAILQGKKLVPFWRGKSATRGINARRVLAEPRPFDLVLWVQGSAAAPYLEEGELTSPETWRRINRVFGGEFIGFAFWFN